MLDKFLRIHMYQLAYGVIGCIINIITDYDDNLVHGYRMDGFKLRATDIVYNHPNDEFAVWCCDIKQFKNYNNQFGYERGDRILSELAKKILETMSEEEILGHISGQQIVILTHNDGKSRV